MNVLVALLLPLLLGTKMSLPSTQPPRPVVLPEAKLIRAIPPPAPTSPPEATKQRHNIFGLPAPKSTNLRIAVLNGQIASVTVVQANGERATLSQEELKQLLEAPPPAIPSSGSGIIVANGAVYINTGGLMVPMNGGGASGCFGVSAERNEQIQRTVRLQFEQEKKEAEKKK